MWNFLSAGFFLSSGKRRLYSPEQRWEKRMQESFSGLQHACAPSRSELELKAWQEKHEVELPVGSMTEVEWKVFFVFFYKNHDMKRNWKRPRRRALNGRQLHGKRIETKRNLLFQAKKAGVNEENSKLQKHDKLRSTRRGLKRIFRPYKDVLY